MVKAVPVVEGRTPTPPVPVLVNLIVSINVAFAATIVAVFACHDRCYHPWDDYHLQRDWNLVTGCYRKNLATMQRSLRTTAP
jgi:hypothetical protein